MGNSLSSSYLLGTSEMARDRVETDEGIKPRSLQRRLRFYIEVIAMTYVRALKSDYLIGLTNPLGLEFLEL